MTDPDGGPNRGDTDAPTASEPVREDAQPDAGATEPAPGSAAPEQPSGPSRWRTADVPAPLLAVAIILWAGAALLCAGYGGTVGIILAAALLAAAIGVAVVWSSAPSTRASVSPPQPDDSP